MSELSYILTGAVTFGIFAHHAHTKGLPEFYIIGFFGAFVWPLTGAIALGWYLASKAKDSP